MCETDILAQDRSSFIIEPKSFLYNAMGDLTDVQEILLNESYLKKKKTKKKHIKKLSCEFHTM